MHACAHSLPPPHNRVGATGSSCSYRREGEPIATAPCALGMAGSARLPAVTAMLSQLSVALIEKTALNLGFKISSRTSSCCEVGGKALYHESRDIVLVLVEQFSFGGMGAGGSASPGGWTASSTRESE